MIHVIQNNDVYELTFKYDELLISYVKNVPGRTWLPDKKKWTIPKEHLGWFLNEIKGTVYENCVNIISDEHLNENATLDSTSESQIPNIDISDIDQYVMEGGSLYKHQIDFLKYAKSRNSAGFILADEMGLGKALTLDTKIYTPEGFKYMKDICVGDTVFNELGQPVTVLATYNHESLDMYRVTFSDNKSVTCCKDHLWTILDNEHKSYTCSLSDIISGDWRHQKNRRGYKYQSVHIPKCRPVQFESQPVPLDSYLVGALLGDGCISIAGTVGFSSADVEMIDMLNNCVPYGYHLHSTPSAANIDYTIVRIHRDFDCINNQNAISTALKSLGLVGTKSHTKFVPDIYKYNSVDVRLGVLQGLIDTDGYVNNDNGVIYTTVSERLKDDVVFLSESLGCICTEHYNDNTNSWDVSIKCDDPSQLCRLSRKKSKLHPRKYKPRRSFKSIEYVGKLPGKCITVSGDSKLYLCEHFIVTHNTLEVINYALYQKKVHGYKHCLIICCVNSAKYSWKEDIEKHTKGAESAYILGTRKKRNGGIRYGTSGADKTQDLISGHMYSDPSEPELPFFLITNIESLRTRSGKQYTLVAEIVKMTRKKEMPLIALDEIHKNMSPKSTQGKMVLKIKQMTGSAIEWIPMTGTPIVNKPTDVFTPLKLIGVHSVKSYWEWCKLFVIYGGYGDHEIMGYKNIPQLKQMLQNNMLRRLKKDVLDLPDKIHHNIYVDNTPTQAQLYASLQTEIYENKESILGSMNPLASFLRLRQVNGSPELVDKSIVVDDKYLSKNAKLAELMRLLEDIIERDEKVVIFSNWVEPLKTLYRFVAAKYKTTCFTGTMSEEDRQKHKRVFLNNPDYKIMLGTIGALGVNHTLTVATNVIFYDEPWTPGDKIQAEDRCHRIGSKYPLNIYTLLTVNTVDDTVHKIIGDKADISGYIVDGKLDLRNNPELFEKLLGDVHRI